MAPYLSLANLSRKLSLACWTDIWQPLHLNIVTRLVGGFIDSQICLLFVPHCGNASRETAGVAVQVDKGKSLGHFTINIFLALYLNFGNFPESIITNKI